MARDPDVNDAAQPAANHPVCPECGYENIPDAAFCARCGHSLDDEPPAQVIDVEPVDSQATSTFRPVTSTVTPPATSPWAPPGHKDSDPGQTAALPTPPPSDQVVESPPMVVDRTQTGPRGFLLGMLAVLLILAVLAVYIYVAWLGDSTRNTVDSWLPWM